MSTNGINFGKCDFGQDVVVGKTELQQKEGLERVKFLFEEIGGIDISDGIDGKEAQILFDKIGGADGVLSDEELRKAFTDSNKDPSINDVRALRALLTFIADKFAAPTAPENSTAASNAQPTTSSANTGETRTATVQAWGTGEDDCLSRIMKKAYPDIKVGSKEWNELETIIMNANPEIYGDENGNGGRKRLIDGTRHNAVLYTGDTITLPPYPCNGAAQANTPAPAAQAPEATSDTPAAASNTPTTEAPKPELDLVKESITEQAPVKDGDIETIGPKEVKPITGLTAIQTGDLLANNKITITKDGAILTYKIENGVANVYKEIEGGQEFVAQYSID